LAFIIQDLKSIDEIYGETARHSLLGNCGLQLILGANDQATAEYASRALGKRTIRYQSESRTLELFGLPRRTKVEQIREKDLLMPQEIRQLPKDKFVLLVEGQRPILGTKLRYYLSEPYKSAAQNAGITKVDIPEVDFAPILSVPALMQGYSFDPTFGVAAESVVTADSPATAANEGNQQNTVAKNDWKKTKVVRSTVQVNDHSARLTSSARRLKSAVSTSIATSPEMSPRQRKSILNILTETIPDPEDYDSDTSPS
jgi:type IV secretion system protein VirD4